MKRIFAAALAIVALSWAGSAAAVSWITFDEGAGTLTHDGRAWMENGWHVTTEVPDEPSTAALDLSGGKLNVAAGTRVWITRSSPPFFSADSFQFDGSAPLIRIIDFSGLTEVDAMPDGLAGFQYVGGSPTVPSNFGLRYFSEGNFALDNFSLTLGVPEPGVWAMMILGFGLVGGSLRKVRSRASNVVALG